MHKFLLFNKSRKKSMKEVDYTVFKRRPMPGENKHKYNSTQVHNFIVRLGYSVPVYDDCFESLIEYHEQCQTMKEMSE